MWSQLEVGPQGLKEVAIGPERDSADHVAKRSTKENRQKRTRNTKHHVEESLPDRVLHVCAQLNANPAQHEQPQHHHQRQIKPAESRSVQLRVREIKRSSGR